MLCDFCGTRLEGEYELFCPYCGMRQDCGDGVAWDDVREILERGFEALRRDDFLEAGRCFARVLRIDGGNGRAYLGRVMASAEAHSERELAEILKEGMQPDDTVFKSRLSKALKFAPDEMMEVFSGEYYDACALMRAGKIAEALRIFREIEDWHNGASDMIEECTRRLAADTGGGNSPSLDLEIEALREEFRVMNGRYEAMGGVSHLLPEEERVSAMNAAQVARYMELLESGVSFGEGVRRVRLIHDARSILMKAGKFLERWEASHWDSAVAIEDSRPVPEIHATNEPSIPVTTTDDSQPAPEIQATDEPTFPVTTTDDSQLAPEIPATHEPSFQVTATEDSQPTPEITATHEPSLPATTSEDSQLTPEITATHEPELPATTNEDSATQNEPAHTVTPIDELVPITPENIIPDDKPPVPEKPRSLTGWLKHIITTVRKLF